MKSYLLNLPEELHKTLKLHVTINDTSMSKFIIEAIKEKLEKVKNNKERV